MRVDGLEVCRGEISEWRATLVVKATACLSRADRGVADAELAGRLGSMGDRQVETEAKRVACRLDPRAFTDRLRRAEAERRVTVRPAPDTMAYLTALVPMQQGVAAYAALTREAATVVANGDQRTRGQVTADLLVERVTGQVAVDTVPVEVQLVISDQTLAGASDEPGHLAGYGPVPAPWARDLVRDSAAQVWVRRLYADHGRLVAMESTRRRFPKGLRRFIVARDQTCRTPWCDAPIRHLDHAVPVDADGPTSETNGQGLCEACNHTKQALGWRARPGPAGASQVVTLTTPTGHEYESRPPSRSPRSSLLETYFGQAIELHVA